MQLDKETTMTERTYTITVTERQARIISNACELMARIEAVKQEDTT